MARRATEVTGPLVAALAQAQQDAVPTSGRLTLAGYLEDWLKKTTN